MYSVLNKLSEYIWFYIAKKITSYTLVAFFKNRRNPSAYPEGAWQILKPKIAWFDLCAQRFA